MGIMQGYLIPPYILPQDKKEKIYLPYKKENLQIIRDNMKTSAMKGSSKALANLTNWEIYAKTGTVQVCSLEKLNEQKNTSGIKKKSNHHGFFACWAKYKNDRPIIIVFIIENNGSSKYTVEIAKKFFNLYEQSYKL